jgi:hypothetical protein
MTVCDQEHTNMRKLKKLKTRIKKFVRVQRNRRKIYTVLTGLIILSLSLGLFNTNSVSNDRQYRLNQNQAKLESTIKALEASEKEKVHGEKALREKTRREAEYRSLIKELRKQVSLKRERERRENLLARAARAVNPVGTAQAAEPSNAGGGCGDNQYARFIYQKESGCSTTARNANGCYGIGQACPGSKIAHCGASYSCQNAYFSDYAISRYGSWQAAYNFWVANHWW